MQVYNVAASNIVSAAMDGLNATVFAYGVTSSGKTFTMMVRRPLRSLLPSCESLTQTILRNALCTCLALSYHAKPSPGIYSGLSDSLAVKSWHNIVL